MFSVLVIGLVAGMGGGTEIYATDWKARTTTDTHKDFIGTVAASDSGKTVTDASLQIKKLDEWEASLLAGGEVPIDTMYVAQVVAGSDTYKVITKIDEAGNQYTFSSSTKSNGNAKNFMQFGPYGGAGDSITYQGPIVFYVVPIRPFNLETTGGLLNPCVDGSGAIDISSYVRTNLITTNGCIKWQETWTYRNVNTGSDTLRLDIKRTTMTRRSDPYFDVLYEIKSADTAKGGDTLRIAVDFDAQAGHANRPLPVVAGNAATYDVGYIPGFGIATRRRAWSAERITSLAGGLVFGVADIGNPYVADDTLSTGASAFLSAYLKAQAGSGTKEFVAGFASINSSRTIVPNQIIYNDSSSLEVNYRWGYDSTLAHVDTTAYWEEGGHDRLIWARTAPIALDCTTYKTFEFVVGKARILNDQLPPIVPKIVFMDGTVLTPTNTRQR
jgi:hypothetical protein